MSKPRIFKHVPPQWPEGGTCKIAFVGEAPSDDEVWKGVPLVGPAGRIFNQLLRTANLRREEFLVTNVFDEQLPDNDVKNWCAPAKEAKAWRADGYDLPPIGKGQYLRPEHAWHLDRLAEELARAKPNVIVPLGGTALWAFTGYSNIMARRGAVAEATMTAPGTKLLPTLHPSFLFHSYKYFTVVAGDLIKAREESEDPRITTTARELWLDPTLDDIAEFKRRYLDGAPYIVTDIETVPKYRQITAVGFADGPHHAITIPFVDPRQPDRSYWRTLEEELRAWEAVRAVLAMPQPKVLQNGTYDVQWQFALMGIPTLNYAEDTRLQHHALFPELPKDLGFLGATYARERSWKVMRHRPEEKRDA